jgi:hypothetical protein
MAWGLELSVWSLGLKVKLGSWIRVSGLGLKDKG